MKTFKLSVRIGTTNKQRGKITLNQREYDAINKHGMYRKCASEWYVPTVRMFMGDLKQAMEKMYGQSKAA